MIKYLIMVREATRNPQRCLCSWCGCRLWCPDWRYVVQFRGSVILFPAQSALCFYFSH